MNERDRKRWAELVRSEFTSRMKDLSKEPTATELAAARKLVIGDLGIGKRLAELRRIEKRQEELSEALRDILKASSPKHKRYGAPSIDELLDAAADDRLRGASLEDRKEQLRTAERKVLAQVEAAETRDELRQIGESLGLIGKGGAE